MVRGNWCVYGGLLLEGLWMVELVLAAWGAWVAHFFGRRMARVAARPLGETFPRVAVIVPIQGLEAYTATNIQALLAQNYPHYRLIFAVESMADPVCGWLRKLAATQPAGRVDVVSAGPAQTRGQKVHNQLAAIARTTAHDEILAFMDADAKPNPNWLHALALPLTYGPHIGAVTGYRYYVPMSEHPANAVACVMNAMVGSLLGPYRRTVAWGGTMAIRRSDFFKYGVYDGWQGALSDDYVLSDYVKHKAHAKIHFVPQCLVASPAWFGWASLTEFAVRQYRITRVCAGGLWWLALAGVGLYWFTLLSSATTALIAGMDGRSWWWRPALVFVALYGLGLIRGVMLRRTGRRLLPEHWPRIQRNWFWFTLGLPAVQALTLFFLLRSAFGRRITWRGIRYEMISPTATKVLGRPGMMKGSDQEAARR